MSRKVNNEKFLQNVSKYFGSATSFEILSQVCFIISCDENLIIFFSTCWSLKLIVRFCWKTWALIDKSLFGETSPSLLCYCRNKWPLRVNQQAAHMGQTSEYYLALYTECKPIQIVYDKWLKWKAFIFKSSYSIVCVPKIVINLAFIGEQ